jgi:L-iditol 2-dehydrogenase
MASPQVIEIRRVAKPEPGPGEVLVKIEACAICTTEQRIYSGVQEWKRFPYVGGHEAAGIVEAFGPGTESDLQIGDRVAILSATCGYCANCRAGHTSKCLHREGFWQHAGLWGTWGFAEYKAVRPRGLQVMSPGVPFEHAALTEPLSCVVHGVRRANVVMGDEVVVIGAGPMGLLNAMVLKAVGAVVTVLEVQEARCQKALAAGVERALQPDNAALETVRGLNSGRGPDMIVVASSTREAYELGNSLLGPLSRLLAFSSVHPQGATAIDMTSFHRNETQLLGAVSSDIDDILVTGKLISNGILDLSQVVECIVPFGDLAQAMERSLQPDTYRVVLRM